MKRASARSIPTWQAASTTWPGCSATPNRLAEAEPIFRQVLRILAEFGRRTGHEHLHFHTAINNYAGLISVMGLSQDAIVARVRSAIKGEPDGSA